MAESITFNNAVYIIPDVGESNWGQNLTNYFVAIPQGAYQASGGTLPLTADLSFGTNFGLLSKYYKSVTANIAGTGQVRLANTDSIDWRNAANSADLALSVDSSNNLLWNGDIIATAAASPVLSILGTANQITASNPTGNVTLSVPSAFIAPGSIQATSTVKGTQGTFTATANQIVLGTTNQLVISSTALALTEVYTIPDVASSANFVLDHGAYTIAGTWNFSNSITLASSKAVVLTDNSTNTVTVKATNSTTSWTLSLPPTHGTSNQFLQTDGSGNTIWAPGGAGTVTSGAAGNLTLYPATAASVNDTYVQNAHNITIGIATQASRSANLAITIPNPGNAITTANVVLDVGNYTLPGAYSFTGISTFSGGAGAITMSASTIAMGANKITGVANGTVSTDAAAFGQVPVITNWASYTPTIVGFGTVANVSFRWKQIGDTVYVSGIFQAGTVTASTGSISLPNSFTIFYNASSGMSSNQDLIGLWQSSKTELTDASSDAGGMITDGSTTTTVFFSRSGSTGSSFPPTAANGISGNTNYTEVNFWFIHV
jgi:hypothetical protein